MVFLSKQAEEFPDQYDTLLSASEELEGRVLPIIVDVDVEDSDRPMELFGVRAANVPAVRLINLVNLKKYTMDAPFTKENYLSFVAAWEAGELLLPLLGSQEIPDTQEEPVYVVVGNSFDDQVRNSGKNVFINIYAPWSGQCKELAPIWEKLAVKFAGVDNVRIAKMDGTANKVRNLQIEISPQSFPMLMLFLESGDVKYYNGSRTLEDLIKFVESRGDPR
jgi:protein disulfide-isomerase A1